ncbi:malonyl-CoA decarboxylase [Poseidonocella pacifica]|uniref:Malonyl-CoA decarboxylase n=1 Tax=Poseidonocella pacifica TaxID=871651 RepID=A0A1I0Y3I2_9RHOB|nr:malonyl-CoA decarboxylase [Poseidonocella pacifica]SFB07905.1 malonyl-CoA decarboxylase [Poseidonocella pacifica]
MTILADLLSTVFERRLRRAPELQDDRPMPELTAKLLGATGEISGLSVAQVIFDRFERMEDAEKLDFFRHLAVDLNISASRVREALSDYEAAPTKATYRAFMAASEPPRQELVRRMNHVSGATGALVRMRADLLRLGREEPELQALDLDFRHLFASWFNRGFLVLRPINWSSPAAILEKIIAYEAVHAIDSWEDLRRRLAPSDRRCFAFFHPAMPDEPLIFVEVALTRGVPGSIQTLLAEDRAPLDAHEADTAVFYSISNCQQGLASISFGNSLIKQVAADLAVELPGLKTFVTLSPIPGLTKWMTEAGIDFAASEPDVLRRCGAGYLLHAKRPDGQPLDPVARFHLGNGAEVHQVHGDADTSPKGRAQSAGVMVNYLYDLSKVSQNHERFAATGEIVASAEVRSLADAVEKQRLKDSA